VSCGAPLSSSADCDSHSFRNASTLLDETKLPTLSRIIAFS